MFFTFVYCYFKKVCSDHTELHNTLPSYTQLVLTEGSFFINI